MMRVRAVVRDAVVVCLAVAGGWWLHDAGVTVLAQRTSSSSARNGDAGLAFQLVGEGREQSLTVYNTESHTLYVYPRVTEGNSHISCEYSFRVSVPGAPIERQNCPVGSLTQ